MLFFEPEFLHERAVLALVVALEILQMRTALGDEAQKTAAGVFVLAIFVEMSRKFLNAARENSDLHLGRPRVGVVALGFFHFVGFLALRKHVPMIAQLAKKRKVQAMKALKGPKTATFWS